MTPDRTLEYLLMTLITFVAPKMKTLQNFLIVNDTLNYVFYLN